MPYNKHLRLLKKFIAIKSIRTNYADNTSAIEFISQHLKQIGFTVRIEGKEKTNQPAIIAHFCGFKSKKKIVLYGHYDVAPIKKSENWRTRSPFMLEEINGRLFGRGIADNKGPLLIRLEAIRHLIKSSSAIPEILWLIQGEEEINDLPIAKNIFKHEIKKFKATVYIEETGFNDIESCEEIAFLWSPTLSKERLLPFQALLNNSLNSPRIEYRHLNKLSNIEMCPLLNNLPENAVYIGFGPNDKSHSIHRENESLDKEKLIRHKKNFENFLTNYATCDIDA